MTRAEAVIAFIERLTITSGAGWDPFDTVFKVTTSGGRQGIGSATAAASSSASGHGAGNLVDHSYLNFWQSGGSVPVNITLDQGSAKNVAYLAVNQREDSVTQTASSSRRTFTIWATCSWRS